MRTLGFRLELDTGRVCPAAVSLVSRRAHRGAPLLAPLIVVRHARGEEECASEGDVVGAPTFHFRALVAQREETSSTPSRAERRASEGTYIIILRG